MPDEDKIRKKVIIEYPAGTELSKSRKSRDGLSPLVRSTDKTKKGVQTQVEIFLEDEAVEARTARIPTDRVRLPTARRWEPTPVQQDIIMGAIEHGVDSVLDRIELAIREWVANRSARKAESARRREDVATRAEAEREVVAAEFEPHVSPAAKIAEPGSRVEVALGVPTISMTLAEWNDALHALLLTHAMSTELWQALAHARIGGADAAVREKQREMAKLTPDEFEDRVAEMLSANPGLVDEPLSELLVRLFETPSPDDQSIRATRKSKHNFASPASPAASPMTAPESTSAEKEQTS